MASIDIEYHGLLLEILERGYTYEDPNRKGVNRLEILSHTFRHEFKNGFPAISTKKLHYKNVVTELLWFLRGDTNIKYLVDNGCNIWNKDAYNHYLKTKDFIGDKPMIIEEFIERIKADNLSMSTRYYKLGDLGPVYGRQWRKQVSLRGKTGIGKQIITDQISNLIKSLKEKPLGTEHIVNSWNAAAILEMALPPCHYGFQVVIRPLTIDERSTLCPGDLWSVIWSGILSGTTEEELDLYNIPKYGFELHWNQRSVDTFLGLPYNIASYATLALILEKITGYKALAIQGNLNKVHLYDNSLDAVKEQLSRDVLKYDKCQLKFDNSSYKFDTVYKDIDMFLDELYPEDFELVHYDSYPAINVKMLERNE